MSPAVLFQSKSSIVLMSGLVLLSLGILSVYYVPSLIQKVVYKVSVKDY